MKYGSIETEVPITIDQPTGTAPLTIASTTRVTNLNVDEVDGYHLNQGVQTTDSPSFLNATAVPATTNMITPSNTWSYLYGDTGPWTFTYNSVNTNDNENTEAQANATTPTIGQTYLVSFDFTFIGGDNAHFSFGGYTSPDMYTTGHTSMLITATAANPLVISTVYNGDSGDSNFTFTNIQVENVSGGVLTGQNLTINNNASVAGTSTLGPVICTTLTTTQTIYGHNDISGYNIIASSNLSGPQASIYSNNNTISGGGIVALGYMNVASGTTSIAMGAYNQTLDGYAIGMGIGNTVYTSSGVGIGTWTTASGNGAVAIGFNLNQNIGTFMAGASAAQYAGYGQVAIGYCDSGQTHKATGNQAMVLGANCNATGNGTVCIGIGVNSSTASSLNLGIGGLDFQITSAGLFCYEVFFPMQHATSGAPTYVKGGMYFDTTLNKLRIGGATGWETVTSI